MEYITKLQPPCWGREEGVRVRIRGQSVTFKTRPRSMRMMIATRSGDGGRHLTDWLRLELVRHMVRVRVRVRVSKD